MVADLGHRIGAEIDQNSPFGVFKSATVDIVGVRLGANGSSAVLTSLGLMAAGFSKSKACAR
jgi:hypothetical protein